MKPIQIGGQSERAFPSAYEVISYEVIDGPFATGCPKALGNAASVLPLPASSPFAAR